jgi:hypothetical protein
MLGLAALIVREATPLQASLIGGGLLVLFAAGLVWLERGYEPDTDPTSRFPKAPNNAP